MALARCQRLASQAGDNILGVARECTAPLPGTTLAQLNFLIKTLLISCVPNSFQLFICFHQRPHQHHRGCSSLLSEIEPSLLDNPHYLTPLHFLQHSAPALRAGFS